jgi:DHA1 family tetracycline resistance protein-like MFS transporter
VLQTTFVLYTGYRFGWNAQAMGMYLAFVGIASVVVQTLLVRPAVKLLKERGAMLLGLSCGVVGFVIFASANSGPMFYLGLPIFSLIGLVQAGYQGIATTRVSPSEQGRLQGANAVIGGLAGMIGPSLFTLTFAFAIGAGRHLHVPGLAIYLAAALLMLALVLTERFSRPQQEAEAAVSA